MSKFIINSGFFDSKKDLEVYKLIDCNDESVFYVKNLPIGYKYFKCKINREVRCLHLDSKIYGSETDVIEDVKPLKSCKECKNIPPTPSVTPSSTVLSINCDLEIDYLINDINCDLEIDYLINDINCDLEIDYLINNINCDLEIDYSINNINCDLEIDYSINYLSK